jgi:hypothetical protein
MPDAKKPRDEATRLRAVAKRPRTATSDSSYWRGRAGTMYRPAVLNGKNRSHAEKWARAQSRARLSVLQSTAATRSPLLTIVRQTGAMQAPLELHRDLYAYWDRKRAGQRMPARSDIDPSEIRSLLPHFTLVEVTEGRFRFRLVGTAVTDDFGRDPTGTFIGSNVSPPAFAAALVSAYERVRETGEPIFTAGDYRAPSGLTHAVARLLLPLADDGRAVNMIAVSRISRIDRSSPIRFDWLGGATGRLDKVVDVASVEVVSALTAWSNCIGARLEPRAEISPNPTPTSRTVI